jgi:hypothetical protein
MALPDRAAGRGGGGDPSRGAPVAGGGDRSYHDNDNTVGAALAALEKEERAVVVVAVNNNEEVFVAAVDQSVFWVLSTEHGSLFQSDVRTLLGVWGHSDMEPAKPHKQEEVMES